MSRPDALRLWNAILAMSLLVGCRDPHANAGTPLPADPEQALRTIERSLIEASVVRLECSAESEGVVRADLSGTVEFDGDEVRLRHRGTFVDRPVDLHLGFEGDLFTGGDGDHRFERGRPADLREAMIVGMTRMGLLHNLARLSGAREPDHVDGDVESWLGVRNASWGPEREGESGSLRAIEFELLVDGQPAADVRLWIDPRRQLPLEREQTVRFEKGEMRVTERYRSWEIDPTPDR